MGSLQTINANQDEVMVKLREYAQRTYKPQNQLMVFFAGHGHYDDVYGEGYVVARNSLANDEGKNTYISHNRIRFPTTHLDAFPDLLNKQMKLIISYML